LTSDHYEILGIEEDATQEEVKSAYRRLAKSLHPDMNKDDSTGTSDKFKDVKEAYEVLSNPLKREKYDLERMRSRRGQTGPPPPTYAPQKRNTFFYSGPPIAPQRGADIKLSIAISFQESFLGMRRGVDIGMPVSCDHCGGSGAAPSTPVSSCPTCKGSGALLAPVQTPQGYVNQRVLCSTCNGRGILMQQFCPKCSGVGLINGVENVAVSLPPGVEDGAIIKLNGKGGHGLGNGPRGDLLVTVVVKEEQNMKREDNDLYIEESISLPKAVFGGKHRVNTIEGRRTLRIPPMTKSRTEFLIEGEGFPDPVSGEHGDLYVVVYIDPPEQLSDNARTLLKKLAVEMGEDLEQLGI